MSTSHVKIQKIDPNVVVLCAGYEDRLIRGNSIFGKPISWDEESGFPSRDFCPLTAGGRYISPEELDSILCEKIGLDDDGLPPQRDDTDLETVQELPWQYHNAYPCDPHAPLLLQKDLFVRCWTNGRVNRDTACISQERAAEIDTLLSTQQGSRAWRDSLAMTRTIAAREIRDICLEVGCRYEIDKGLCCFTLGGMLSVTEWMEKMAYCACFGRDSAHDMRYIESEKYRILVVDLDAESG